MGTIYSLGRIVYNVREQGEQDKSIYWVRRNTKKEKVVRRGIDKCERFTSASVLSSVILNIFFGLEHLIFPALDRLWEL